MADLFDDQVPITRPFFGHEESDAVAQVIESGWITQGPRTIEFEETLARYVGARHAVATNSCTTALHLIVRLSGIGAGDEVICPSFTCMATANSVAMAGAETVFADIDSKTFNLDPEHTETVITPRTKAILLVHQIGLPADYDAFALLAKKHGLVLIEDGACSLGATYNGKMIGGLGSTCAISFHPRKTITTGEGGMIFTNDEQFAEKARVLRNHGASVDTLARHHAKGTLVQEYPEPGYNYRYTDLQAAVGLAQFNRIDRILEARRAQARRYDDALSTLDDIIVPFVPPHMTHAYTSYLVRLGEKCPVSRDELVQELAKRGIACRVGIPPLHKEACFRSNPITLPVTEKAADSTIFLPIFPGMTEQQQERVIDAFKQIVVGSKTMVPRA